MDACLSVSKPTESLLCPSSRAFPNPSWPFECEATPDGHADVEVVSLKLGWKSYIRLAISSEPLILVFMVNRIRISFSVAMLKCFSAVLGGLPSRNAWMGGYAALKRVASAPDRFHCGALELRAQGNHNSFRVRMSQMQAVSGAFYMKRSHGGVCRRSGKLKAPARKS